jgi:threonine dehydrogenase-like Zn-dependent dehydrogenase
VADRNVTIVGAHISIVPEQDSSPGRWNYRDEGRLWLQWLASGKIEAESLVTHRLKPENVDNFYYDLVHASAVPVAAVIQWN